MSHFNNVYFKEYQQVAASNKPSIPGYCYLKKMALFMQERSQSGEVYIEYLRESCTKQEGKCDYCRITEWQGPVMESVPCPFPDKSKEGHYMDVFSTLKVKTSEDGSPREIDDFLPRVQVKKLFAKGESNCTALTKPTQLAKPSKKSRVAVNLLEDSVKL